MTPPPRPTTQHQIYQLRITLAHVHPRVWRRLLMPAHSSFWAVHVAIQDAFGWEGTHLHEFRVRFPGKELLCVIGSDPDWSAEMGRDLQLDYEERDEILSKWMSPANAFARYVYDFGDQWHHSIRLEAVLPFDTREQYPQCIAGRRACPPEDCGGADGYLAILRGFRGKPEPVAWRGRIASEWVNHLKDFDPDAFSPTQVSFRDPQNVSHAIEDEF